MCKDTGSVSDHIKFLQLYPPPTNFVVGLPFSRCLSVRASVPNVLFPKYLEDSSMDFHQTLRTHLYMQDK